MNFIQKIKLNKGTGYLLKNCYLSPVPGDKGVDKDRVKSLSLSFQGKKALCLKNTQHDRFFIKIIFSLIKSLDALIHHRLRGNPFLKNKSIFYNPLMNRHIIHFYTSFL